MIEGKTITLRDRGCLLNGEESSYDQDSVSVSVYLTNSCNAECKFCCNPKKSGIAFDITKFQNFIKELETKAPIRKITFTGGEPAMEISRLQNCVEIARNSCNKIIICTNGFLLRNYRQPDISFLKLVDNISVSRHHWVQHKNDKLFCHWMGNPFVDIPFLDKVNISCNLIEGYVDSWYNMINMLEFASRQHIENVSFVKLMPVNQFCIQNRVDIDTNAIVDKVIRYTTWSHHVPRICNCSNYVYTAKNGMLIKFYIRENMCSNYNMGSYIIYRDNQIYDWY